VVQGSNGFSCQLTDSKLTAIVATLSLQHSHAIASLARLAAGSQEAAKRAEIMAATAENGVSMLCSVSNG
jgi:hypothetical protein